VLTAATEEALATPERLLGWQTGRPMRIVDPDGHVVREMDPDQPETPPESNAPRERKVTRGLAR
jgi:hypothetical protein